jgi:hypothetical protein
MWTERRAEAGGYGYSSQGSEGVPRLSMSKKRRAATLLRRAGCGQERGGVRIGDHVIYGGRRYVLLGLDPMGVPERRADLEDLETGERLRVPVSDLLAARD